MSTKRTSVFTADPVTTSSATATTTSTVPESGNVILTGSTQTENLRPYEFRVPGTNDTALIEAGSFHEAVKLFRQLVKEAGIE